MRNLLLCTLFFFATAFTSKPGPILVDKLFTIELPDSKPMPDAMFNALKKANNNMIYMATLALPGQANTSVFSVSRYTGDERSMEEAFAYTVAYRANEEGHKLLESNTYEKDGKTLRYKITQLVFENGKELSCIMYYFMNGTRSKHLYELKTVCDPAEQSTYKAYLEKVALSISFVPGAK